MTQRAFLGIDVGTQGLSAVLTDGDLNVLATGDGAYAMVAGLEEGCYEQAPGDWESALVAALAAIGPSLAGRELAAIGVAGQMHGEVLTDGEGEPLIPARLWCDTRNQAEGEQLTERFGCKAPRRSTVARWLWTLRNRPGVAEKTRHLTTPAGWIAHRLTGEWRLGVGDASGMLPIDQATLDYDTQRIEAFDAYAEDPHGRSLADLLPTVGRAGDDGGRVTAAAAARFGLPEGTPVAPAEGDQPAALAGSLIGEAGMVSTSFGTSVCANAVGDRPFEGVSDAIDHFCAPDGKPINMAFLRNGTTFMNTVVGALIDQAPDDDSGAFARVMEAVAEAPADCGGLLATPFIDDEPGLGVMRGGAAGLLNLTPSNATAGCLARAALLATIFNLRLGVEVLDAQGYPRNEIVLTGGLARTPRLGQLVADAMRTPVSLLASADEGTAWGAAVLAKFRAAAIDGDARSWTEFLADHAAAPSARFTPDEPTAQTLDAVFARYRALPVFAASGGPAPPGG